MELHINISQLVLIKLNITTPVHLGRVGNKRLNRNQRICHYYEYPSQAGTKHFHFIMSQLTTSKVGGWGGGGLSSNVNAEFHKRRHKFERIHLRLLGSVIKGAASLNPFWQQRNKSFYTRVPGVVAEAHPDDL